MIGEENAFDNNPRILRGEGGNVFTLLEEAQLSMKAYIISLLANKSDVEDILQETNRYLIENQDKYEAGTNFKAWAFKVAYFRVKSHIRDRQRNKVVSVDEQILDQLSEVGAEFYLGVDERMAHLDRCIRKLKVSEHSLIKKHYFEKRSLVDIARQLNRPANSLHQVVSRIRKKLKNCIEKQR